MVIIQTNKDKERALLIQRIQQFVPITRAKAMFLDLVREIKDSEEAVAIIKNGVPEAVLLSMGKFQGLLETLDILSDEKAITSIRKAKKRMWVDYEEVSGR